MTTISTADVLDSVFYILSQRSTALPGYVESYDPATQKADIRPGLLRVVPPEEEEDDEEYEELPIIPSVTVLHPRSGEHFIHVPIKKGDNVLLVICDSDLNAWMGSDGKAPVDPGSVEAATLNGAVAIPGLFPSNNRIASADANDMTMGKDGGSNIVRFTDSEVQAGGSDALALAQETKAELDKIQVELDKIATTLGSLVVAGGAGAPATGSFTTLYTNNYSSSDVGTTVLKGS